MNTIDRNLTPIRSTALGGVLGAVIFCATYFIRLPIGWANGYVNLGDGVIFLAAWMIGPAAGLCAAVGSALADLAAGYAIYIAPTIAIKGLMGFIAGRAFRNSNLPKRAAVMTLCELLMVAGYAAYESVVFTPPAALASIPMNLLQGTVGVLAGAALTKIASAARL